MCLGTIQARTCSAGTCIVSGRCYAPNTGYSLPCNTFTDTLGSWVMNVLIMPLRLVHLALSPVAISPLAGFIITMTCGDCNSISDVLEKLHSMRNEATSFPQGGSQCCVLHRVLCLSRTHLHHLWFCSRPLSRASIMFFMKSNGKPNYVCLCCVEFW